MSAKRVPDLGRLEVCLKVKSLKKAQEFYEHLGYRKVAGVASQGWAVLERDGFRIDLFQHHIKENVLNYRGGDVRQIVESLKARRLKPFDVKTVGSKGAGHAYIRDPDGNLIFFDTTPRERTARKKARRGA